MEFYILKGVVKAPDTSTIFNAISHNAIYLMPRQDGQIVMISYRDRAEGWLYLGTPDAPVGALAKSQAAIMRDFDAFGSSQWGLWQRVEQKEMN